MTSTLTEKQRFWLGHLEQWRESGDALVVYARSHNLVVNTFYGWKKKLVERGLFSVHLAVPSSFVRVVAKPVADEWDSHVLRIHFPNGCRLEVATVNEATCHTVISALLRVSP